MPRYDFKCLDCGHVFEGSKKMREPSLPCEECGGPTSVHFGGGAAPQAHFQGGGWAKDNYASTGSKPLTVNQMLDRNS